MTKYFCDFCKKEAEHIFPMDIRTNAPGIRKPVDEHRYDLCHPCSLAFYHMMTGELSANDYAILSPRIGR